MSIFSARTGGGTATVNFDLIDLPDGTKAVAHVVLGGDGNPIVPAADASIQALAGAVQSGVAAAQAFVINRLLTIVDSFGATVATTIVPAPSGGTDAFGNPLT